jgi:hypothetical protein
VQEGAARGTQPKRVAPAYRVIPRVRVEIRPPRQPDGILGEQDPILHLAGIRVARDRGGGTRPAGWVGMPRLPTFDRHLTECQTEPRSDVTGLGPASLADILVRHDPESTGTVPGKRHGCRLGRTLGEVLPVD